MIFPAGTINYTTEISGITSETIVAADTANPVTILSIRMQQEKDLSTTNIDCGTKRLARNWAKDYPLDFPFAVCTNDVVISKTGNDIAFVSVSYLPYNINEGTESVVLTPTPVTISRSFTFGEIATVLILIPLLSLILYQTIMQAFKKPIRWHK